MQKPRLNFWQIWNMSFGFLGIQFGWGLQMANMSAIYSYLGANADALAILWLAAPVTGVLNLANPVNFVTAGWPDCQNDTLTSYSSPDFYDALQYTITKVSP